MNIKNSVFRGYAIGYSECNEADRKKSREHWRRVHEENLRDNRSDLYKFSAQILEVIELVDNGRIKDLF